MGSAEQRAVVGRANHASGATVGDFLGTGGGCSLLALGGRGGETGGRGDRILAVLLSAGTNAARYCSVHRAWLTFVEDFISPAKCVPRLRPWSVAPWRGSIE